MSCDILAKMMKTIDALERLNNISKKPVVSQELLDDQKESISVMRDYFENLDEVIDDLNSCKRDDFEKILHNVIGFYNAYLDASEFLEDVYGIIDEFLKNYRELNE